MNAKYYLFKKILLTVTITILLLLPQIAISSDTKKLNTISEQFIKEGNFRTNRTLDDYRSIFGKEFYMALKSLHRTECWLDAGSGVGFQIYGYYGLKLEPENEDCSTAHYKGNVNTARLEDMKKLANAIMVTFEHLNEENINKLADNVSNMSKEALHEVIEKIEKKGQGKVQIFNKRFFEDISIDEYACPKIDLLTDFFGVISYTHDPSTVLEKYKNLMDEYGKAFIFLGVPGAVNNTILSDKVEISEGKEILFVDWIKTLPNFKSKLIGNYAQSIVLELNPDLSAREKTIPKLRLKYIDTKSRIPPYRVFTLLPERVDK
ncbi:MAG: hypothetical protein HQK51_20265 [Oligoflexia bacterium]|nr:hypothetical protein [Oligoflexia bacterium]